MSIKYIVRKDLLQVADGVEISALMQQQIERVEKKLETNPRPEGSAPAGNGAFRIWVAEGSEELKIIYKVFESSAEIFILWIEPPGWVRSAINAIDDLFRFAP